MDGVAETRWQEGRDKERRRAMSDARNLTREGLALELLDRITRAEGKETDSVDRTYLLGLLREVLHVIDGGQSLDTSDAKVVSISTGQSV
jgi:hypothetical protein